MMDKFLTLDEAAQIYHVPAGQLYTQVQAGIIDAVVTTNNTYLVSDTSMRQIVPIDQQPDYDHNLVGQHITMRDAQDQYGISKPTLHSWIHRGMIKILGWRTVRGGRQMLLDAAAVKYYANRYKAAGGHQGTRIFSKV